MRPTLLGHCVAALCVTLGVVLYASRGGLQSEIPEPLPGLLVGVVAAGVSGLVVWLLDARQRTRARLSLLGPVVWAWVLAWATSVYLLLDHPASLRSGRPLLSSMIFAALLAAPFTIYWVVFRLMTRLSRKSAAQAPGS